MTDTQTFWAVVPAAGVGKRMNANRPKQYLELGGQTVLEQTLARLLQAEVFRGIAVAVSEEDGYWPDLPIARHPQIIRAPGGKERADSVLSALHALAGQAATDDWVLVHDAARPCLTITDIHHLIATLRDDPIGGILAVASHDTLKNVQGESIIGTLDRSHIWRALTPQMFRYGLLKSALQTQQGNPAITDEASALELQGWQPKIVAGRPDNIKITRPEDLALAEFYRAQQTLETTA
ncbi:2-C-methyl-D-erythritol 4-phosphate cytidylyltransferase [Methylovulum psychrotolerans]|uniref:2-C-methyl-D-erythritol 4-phosphate cytidylyltransferase n=1 Tax=Methylovulum psychrotolerans TaxID=1704499 RepID=A0A1Z4BXZ4_9GAMM|nr:2-C-methyl-D-erythritol 4-phosphate cytidylyltransferase [Methylovulum psychrotolerans]ASF46132.1 2-C-methyl-D-erythritol 4-phosphate cytidylyltransferase [Methylovulum psychrotolerans]